MRYVCLLVLLLPSLHAQDGAAIYKSRCASCHDAPTGHTPTLTTIKALSAGAIYTTLSTGVMKKQAEGLSTADIFALLGYIAPTGGAKPESAAGITPTCKDGDAFHVTANAPQWNGWSPSLTNSRFEDAAAAGLTVADVSRLKLKWAFNLGDVPTARSQPAVVGGRVFIASQTGTIYSLDEHTGCTYWGFMAAPGLRGGITLGDANGVPALFLADATADVYAVNAETGQLIWKVRPVENFSALATATPRFYKGVVYQPVASFEEALAADPKFGCCTARGSVSALDAATGKTIWQTFTISDAPKSNGKESGPSGAGVWSSPTIDERAGALYVATGDNYSDPPTETSDAILAMDLKTGKLLWSKQLTADDAFNNGCSTPQHTNCPQKAGPDYDFGQSPILVDLGQGRRELVIGQKSGMVHAIDPDEKGKILWQTRAGAGSPLGGSQWGSASDGKNVYVAISDVGLGVVADAKAPAGYRLTLDPKKGGGLHAIDLKSGKEVWGAKGVACADGRTDCSPAQSAAVTAIPGAVFSGSVDGHLRAYSTTSGDVLWDVDTAREFETVNGKPAHGGSLDAAGPAIIDGLVFVNSGYGQWGGMPGNVMLVFSVNGH